VQFERIEGDVRRHNSVVTVATRGFTCSEKREIGMPRTYITDPNRLFSFPGKKVRSGMHIIDAHYV